MIQTPVGLIDSILPERFFYYKRELSLSTVCSPFEELLLEEPLGSAS